MDYTPERLPADAEWRRPWAQDDRYEDHPLDVKVVGHEVIVRSLYTPGPGVPATCWTSATDGQMDAAARRAMPSARVFMRNTHYGQEIITRTDGTRYRVARVMRYMGDSGIHHAGVAR